MDDLFLDSPYTIDGMHVPRVTAILSKMLSEDYLMYWAQKMGKYNKDIDTIRETAADKGTIVHEMCEKFLRYRELPDYNTVPYQYRSQCKNAFNGFLRWIENINKNYNWKPLMIEQELVCPMYGGTLDALLEIGGKIYIIDFKTSNQLSYKYALQVAAYRKALRDLYGIEVDGCCIIRMEKFKNTDPEEMMFDLHDPTMKNYMDLCEKLFMDIAAGYWKLAVVTDEYKNITGMRVK